MPNGQWCRSGTTVSARLANRWARAAIALAVVLLALTRVAPTAADDQRAVGRYRITAGFERSPVYPQESNALVIHVTDATGAPVEGLEQTLRLRIGVPNQVTETWNLQPAAGRAGVYLVRLALPRAGDYFMDLFGVIGDQPVNERFITDRNGLEKVIAPPRQYPYGSWIVIVIVLGGYLLGLAWFGIRWLQHRREGRRPVPTVQPPAAADLHSGSNT